MAILGTIASSTRQGQSTDTGAMFPLQVITAGSTGISSITFSNIPQTYAHLQVRMTARSSISGSAGDNVYVRFNGDTGTNYRTHQIYGDGSTLGANATNAESSTFQNAIPGGTAAANNFGMGYLDLLDYANTNKNKVVRSLSGYDLNGTALGYIIMRSGIWVNTAAVTSITLLPGSGSFVQYSQFALYGVKSA